MKLIAAFEWNKKDNQIRYMLLKDQARKPIEEMVSPKIVSINAQKFEKSDPNNGAARKINHAIDHFMKDVQKKQKKLNVSKRNVMIEYRTPLRQSSKQKPNPVSSYINSKLAHRIKEEGYHGARLQTLAKRNLLNKLSKALVKMDLISRRAKNYVSELWGVALHMTDSPQTLQRKVKNLWSSKNGVNPNKMTTKQKNEFNLFAKELGLQRAHARPAHAYAH